MEKLKKYRGADLPRALEIQYRTQSRIVPGNHHMRMFWNQVYKSSIPRFLIWSVMGGDVDAHDSMMDASAPLQVVFITCC